MDLDLSFACVGFKRNRVKICCMAATRRVGGTTRRVRSRVPNSSVSSVSSGRGELGSGLSELRVDSVMEGLGELFIQLGESKAISLRIKNNSSSLFI